MHMGGQGVYRKSFYLPLNVTIKLKLLFKKNHNNDNKTIHVVINKLYSFTL